MKQVNKPDHITLNTDTPTRVPNTTLHQISSPDITMVFNTGHRGQINMHYYQTTYQSSTYDMTIDYNKTDEHLLTTKN